MARTVWGNPVRDMPAAVVYMAFNVYAIGLVACMVLSWVSHPKGVAARAWLHRGYAPFLDPIQRLVKPIKIGSVAVDLSVWLLLIGIYLIRNVVVSLLTIPF